MQSYDASAATCVMHSSALWMSHGTEIGTPGRRLERQDIVTSGQSNLTKSASRGAHSPVRGHPRGSKFVPLNSWVRVSY